MIFDVYVIGVSLCHYAFRSFQKPGDLTLGQEGHRRKNSCFKPALFFQMIKLRVFSETSIFLTKSVRNN